ncbi:hypothetical protein VNO78_27159 [Psophocarpus tetragonolobus]|uniref:Uncharacterized protein n=1 Tax=Psophocarpus tetragonolobus TaxID=3891 RepID=A0AAN9S0K3_PSOTE
MCMSMNRSQNWTEQIPWIRNWFGDSQNKNNKKKKTILKPALQQLSRQKQNNKNRIEHQTNKTSSEIAVRSRIVSTAPKVARK